MKRLLKWFALPAIVIFGSLLLLIRGYHVFLTQPASTMPVAFQTTAAANLARSGQNSSDEAIQEADLKLLLAARQQSTGLTQRYGVGRLAIPSCQISLPIFGEATDLTLSAGVALYYPKRGLSGGNIVMAAHNFWGAGDLLLNKIDRAKVGDLILVSDLKQVWQYRIAVNQVVKDTQVDVLDNTRDDRLTLIRCEGGAGTQYRRVVIAKLQKTRGAKSTESALGIQTTTPTTSGFTQFENQLGWLVAQSLSRRWLVWQLWLLVLVWLLMWGIASWGYLRQRD
ncbi:class A sortase [Lacticaseibacillus mingshuiensis]|uniref:Class A sortase n=1 Tax=Lacticaseibacillus mingshuiensis TaxID=2799574 RepID=A0ABW4CEL5_9LACO|nr:class A sortase [Lacticaseibacillus mingshuiensis]